MYTLWRNPIVPIRISIVELLPAASKKIEGQKSILASTDCNRGKERGRKKKCHWSLSWQ